MVTGDWLAGQKWSPHWDLPWIDPAGLPVQIVRIRAKFRENPPVKGGDIVLADDDMHVQHACCSYPQSCFGFFSA